MKPIDPVPYRRATWIVAAILLTAAVSGYFMGLRQTGSRLNPTQPASLVKASATATNGAEVVEPAGSYVDQDRAADGPNARWQSSLANPVQPVSNPFSFTNVSETDRALALSERAARRAYDGAPPVVPHPIPQDSAASCLTCHGEGLTVKDRVASKISHPHYTSCTQCHVPAVGPKIPLVEVAWQVPIAENAFVGSKAPLKGSRAWPQAPPTIPHPTFMRSDCLSCHGPQGLFGLRTPHPERRSCEQCHVPSAEMDQRLFFPGLISGSAPNKQPAPNR